MVIKHPCGHFKANMKHLFFFNQLDISNFLECYHNFKGLVFISE